MDRFLDFSVGPAVARLIQSAAYAGCRWLRQRRRLLLSPALPANNFEMLHRVEMLIARGNRGLVLPSQGRDPNVVVRNRRPLSTQFALDVPVLPSRLDRYVQYFAIQ